MAIKKYGYGSVTALILMGISVIGGVSCSDKAGGPLQKVSSFISNSNNTSVVRLREGEDFTIMEARRFEHGGYFCIVRSAGRYAVTVFSEDGRSLFVEPEVLFSSRGIFSPVVAQLKGKSETEQLILTVPSSPISEGYVEVKILDCSPSSVSEHRVARFLWGFAINQQTYGIMPVLVTNSFDLQYLWIVQKSSLPESPFEVLEQIKWNDEEKRYETVKYSQIPKMPDTTTTP